MTDNNHTITPPPELVEQWREEAAHRQYGSTETDEHIAERAARWGADRELEACCEWVETDLYSGYGIPHEQLRAARRPKPSSLKVQALGAAQRFYANGHDDCNEDEVKDDFDIICRALNSLPD